MQWSSWDIIKIITIFQIFLVSIFLFLHDARTSQRNLLLAAFIFSKALFILDALLIAHSAEVPTFVLDILLIGTSFQLLLGPSMYLLIVVTTSREFSFRIAHLLHLIPFVAHLGFIMAQYHFQGLETKLSMLQGGFPYTASWSRLVSAAFYFHFATYGILALRVLSRSREEAFRYSSLSIERNIGFLTFIIYDYIVVWGLNIVSMFFWFGQTWALILQVATAFNIFFIANAIVYQGLKFPQIFHGAPESRQKYEKNLLTHEEKDRYVKKLVELMASGKPYLNPTLSLPELATQLAIPQHVVSQVLNLEFRQNFYDFVNSHRVEESKRLLCSTSANDKTILDVLYQSGFNSKSVFNTAFKRYTGMTPREFKKSPISPSKQQIPSSPYSQQM